uniref:Uncharacterized protein n=1 Tax=Cyprinodon variegatus TaxID=28743 RepID=A0A3Q2DB09_CYPVA
MHEEFTGICKLICCYSGGMFVFQLFDYYACNGACILFLCVFEALSMGWIFGADKLYGIIKDMTGVDANPFFKICWLYLTPLVSLVSHCLCVGSFICSLVEYQPLTFNRWYVYPSWAYVLGWVLALSSILLVPGWAFYKLATGKGTLRQVRQLSIRVCDLCRPALDDSPTQTTETELQNMGVDLLQPFMTN